VTNTKLPATQRADIGHIGEIARQLKVNAEMMLQKTQHCRGMGT
jgi:hypothetical protein